jgi:hypothetical protein
MKARTIPRPRPPEEVDKRVLVLVFCAVLTLELYTIVPRKDEYRQIEKRRYPYNETKITMQAYIDYLGVRFGFATLVYCLFLVARKYRFQLLLCFIILIGYVVDYILSYNMAGGMFSYSMFMVLAFGAIIIKTIIDEE